MKGDVMLVLLFSWKLSNEINDKYLDIELIKVVICIIFRDV